MTRTYAWSEKDLQDWNFTALGTHLALRVATLRVETDLTHKNPFLGRIEVQNTINMDLSIHEESWELFTSSECQNVVLSQIIELKLLKFFFSNFFFLISSF